MTLIGAAWGWWGGLGFSVLDDFCDLFKIQGSFWCDFAAVSGIQGIHGILGILDGILGIHSIPDIHGMLGILGIHGTGTTQR